MQNHTPSIYFEDIENNVSILLPIFLELGLMISVQIWLLVFFRLSIGW